MMTECLHLRDGRRLQGRRGGWVLLPDETGVEVRVEDREAIVTDQDGRTFTAEIIDKAETMAKKLAGKKSTSAAKGTQASEESGVRWKTFNAFTEHVMPHLPGAVVKVWNYLFFRAYRNVVKLSERNLAAAAGVNKDTAGLALRMLVTTGLARVNFKSKAEGAPSEYWLNPRPASCLESVVALKAVKPDGRKGNRHQNRRKKPPGKSGQ